MSTCVQLPAGAEVDVVNSEGENPVVLAEYARHEEVVKLLKEAMEQAGIVPPPEGLCSGTVYLCPRLHDIITVTTLDETQDSINPSVVACLHISLMCVADYVSLVLLRMLRHDK